VVDCRGRGPQNDCFPHEKAGDQDRVIAACTHFLNDRGESQVNRASVYNNRGLAWGAKGDLDRAIADYTEAIRLNPKDSGLYRSRGYVYFYMGDFAAAADDLLRANDLADNAYAMLWRYFARGRLKQDGAPELGVNAARLKNKDWPYAVIDFYLGRRSLAAWTVSLGFIDP
jgi:lipoprotein NlpI